MSAQNDLAVVPPKETALTVFSTANGLEPWLQQVRAKVDEFQKILPDLGSKKGRDAYASMAHSIAKSKTALEAVGKQLSAEQKEIPKKIDAERKRVWDTLESWQKEVRKPLDDWQAAEDARVDTHNEAIAAINTLFANLDDRTVESLTLLLEAAEAVVISDAWEEFEAEAARTKDQAVTKIRAALTSRTKHEAELAAIAQFNAEKAEREQKERDDAIARAAAEQAQREAAAAAQAERDAAAAREQALIEQAAQAQRDADQKAREAEAAAANQALQLQLAAEQAERQRIQAEADRVAAVQAAEQERLAAEQRQAAAVEQARQDELARQAAAVAFELEQAHAREADKTHKAKINRAALEAFIAGGMPESCAKQAVTLIAQRKIPAVIISY